MTQQNMRLWDRVYKTDPSATKQATVSGQRITSISGQHMILKATETFGPVGIGWGWDVVEERYDQGGAVKDGEGNIIGHETGHTIRIKLWYELDGKRGEVEQFGCTPFAYRSKYGITTDTEAPKKSLTDAIKKALAMLGFSADIFLGLFDDLDYVNERVAEANLEKAEDKEAEIERQREERREWARAGVKLMEGAQSLYELKKLHATYVRSAQRRNEEAYVARFARAYEERKAQLESQNKEDAA